MDNRKKNPFVTIYGDIVDSSDESDKCSPPPTNLQEVRLQPQEYLTPDDNVSTQINKSTQAQLKPETTNARQSNNEELAVEELLNDELTMRAVHAPRESLRQYLKKRMPTPIPLDEKNFLNNLYDGISLLHESVTLRKHDIMELLLEYRANVNIYEEGQTIAHRAAANNDTTMLRIIYRYGGDFSLLNQEGEIPLMTAITFGNTEAIKEILHYWNINISSRNHETILHYAARHDNPKIALYASDPIHRVKLNQRSTNELRTALHIAVKESRVEVTSILLDHGARDEWRDYYGALARDYITNNDIRVLFITHDFSLHHNYNTRCFEPEVTAITAEQQLHLPEQIFNQQDLLPGPSGFKKHRIQHEPAADVAHQQDLQPGHKNHSVADSPILISLQQATTPRQQHKNCHIIYNPELRDDTKLPKFKTFGFEPEYQWTENYPIEQPRPANYTRPDLENCAPKIVYPIDNPNDHKFHLLHLNLEYSMRLKTATRCWYKRDLYEIYQWERNNLDKDLKGKQTIWLKEALQKRFPVKRPIEN
jgi:ankyrin repeat protein